MCSSSPELLQNRSLQSPFATYDMDVLSLTISVQQDMAVEP
jgi:hypothetical protein